jgi:hypothetical protein
VAAYCRGRLLDSARLEPGQAEVMLHPPGGAGGVCRVTLFEELPTDSARQELRPLAERLIYRHPRERLDVDIRPDKRSYLPGERVHLALATTDEKERLRPALVMVAVVDKSVLTLADEKTARSMPTHFLLTSEVRKPEDLEHADFLLGTHPRAPEALDLLLGTQGWRRFAEKPRSGAPTGSVQDAERMLMVVGQSALRPEVERRQLQAAREDFEARAASLALRHERARREVEAAGQDPRYLAAWALVEGYHDGAERARQVALRVLAPLAFLALLAGLSLHLRRRLRGALPGYALAGACLAGLAVLLQGPFGSTPERPDTGSDQAGLVLPTIPRLGEEALDQDKGEDEKGRVKEEGARALSPPTRASAVPAPAPPPPSAPPLTPPAPGMPAPAPARGLRLPVPAAPTEKGGEKKDAEGKDAGGPGGAKGVEKLGAAGKAGGGPGSADKRPGGFSKGGRASQPPPAAADRAPARGGKQDGGEARTGKAKSSPRLVGGRDWPDGKEGRPRARTKTVQLEPMVVREYAHGFVPQPAAGAAAPLGQPRGNFAETLYWHPVLLLPGGRADVAFNLCDSVTRFEVTAYAHTADGRLGAGKRTLQSRLPFTLQPTLPVEVTAGDTLEVPLTVANTTGEARSVELKLAGLANLSLEKGAASQRFTVPAGTPVRKVFSFRPAVRAGAAELTFEGRAEPFADRVRGLVKVVPEGFPVVRARSDLLEGSASHPLDLPRNWVKGTLKVQVVAYPSPLADLHKGLEGLLREPNGCFEQTSTSNYPNVLTLRYLRESGQVKPEVERRARDLLATGYQKLTSFECREPGTTRRRGYEWFGGEAPPHEALTAYGLLQFADMAKVHEVDGAMLQRTRAYLLACRDGKGGFRRNERALGGFGRAPAPVTDAYIAWALTETGKEDLSRELNALLAAARGVKAKDPYFLALVGNALANAGRSKEARGLLRGVVKMQKEDGRVDGAETSITLSGGRDLQVETTALAVLGWLKLNTPDFADPVEKAVRWLGRQRGGHGAFGSTQSTILALKALLAYAGGHKRTVGGGELRLFVGEEKVAATTFAAGATDPVTLLLPDPEKRLNPGRNKVRVEVTGKNVFPHTLTWSYSTHTPASAAGCAVRLGTTLGRTKLDEGDGVRLTVTLANVSGKAQGMAVAVVGLPAGLGMPEDLKQLRDHARVPADGGRALLDSFEVRGRELVLYWRDLAARAKVEVPVDLVARVPGAYRGPASRAYLYYDADVKHWVKPLEVTIAARGE